MSVELGQAREGDMVHVHVQPHPDRVRRDQEVHLFFLIERHLGVAGAGREPAHHHGATPATAADHLGDRIDLAGAERDHRAPRRQSSKLGWTRIGKLREAGPGFDESVRNETLQQRAYRFGPQEHGLHHAAGVQQALGEDVAAIRVGAELYFVHRDELGLAVERHCLHRAGKPPRLRRHDLLLARNEGDVPRTLARHHAVVVLPREETKGKADNPRSVGQHPLDRQMRLARVGRTEHGLHAGYESRHGPMFGGHGLDCKRLSRDGLRGRRRALRLTKRESAT